MSDLKKRTITAIVLIAILFPVVFFGKIYMYILAGILSALASYELEKMYKGSDKLDFVSYINIFLTLGMYVSFILIYIMDGYKYLFVALLGLFIIEGTLMISTKKLDINRLGKSLLTIFYPSIGFASLAIVRNVEIGLYREGLFLLCYVIIICMFTDMFAYFFGCKFGKHKLSPSISPKKSIEGSIAGTVFAVVFGTVFCVLLELDLVLFPFGSRVLSIILTVILSLVLSVIDEIGDLFASKLKRFYGIKDYSNLFPGHGGVLDRFDSYIFASTILLMYLLLL